VDRETGRHAFRGSAQRRPNLTPIPVNNSHEKTVYTPEYFCSYYSGAFRTKRSVFEKGDRNETKRGSAGPVEMCNIRHFLRSVILVGIMEMPAFAGNVTLAWNANTNPIVAGYNIFYWVKGGVSTNKISVGKATNVTISNLVAQATYFFAATTYDASGVESTLSATAVNQPPTFSLVTPASNQQWTNGTFTVTGKAGDILAVRAVYCSLNGSGWTAATTTNNWTNWTASLMPTPGTNSVQAYAMDTSGNISTTNTFKFVYLVRLPLTMNINGKGSVNPNYNGSLLAINENYSMTASASPGFALTNWTDGSGNLLTNRDTLQFTMVTNLMLTANFVDVARPTVCIVTPISNQQWTNGGITATGKAGDNVAVGTVYCSLNGSGWTAATTTNNWTNWTANLTLTPGTNTVQAYAMDTSGNLSSTNTVKFEYVVRMPLAVSVKGKGAVSPNYNGALLAINESYTTTASASPGFGFTNWTDASGNVMTNRATLRFVMGTNLTLTANFVDVQKPTVSIVTPASNQQWTNGGFAITGKAGDNVAVGAVYYSLNGSGWTAATTGNGWTNWTANVTLTPGTNTVQACAVDASGNASATNTVKFVYLVRMPLTVHINGKGTVSQNYNGALLAINENYSMTASAASGFAFTNWMNGSGNMMTNRATLQFTMVTNLTLTANFADVTRPTLSLVAPASNLRVSNTMFAVTGKAGDNVAVEAVYFSLNGSSWMAATTGNIWTNWTALVMLKPGTNTVWACAVDTSGNISPTNHNTVNFVVPPAASATLDSAAYADGQYAFQVSGASGYKYLVQASTDLVNWVSIQTNTAPFTFVDTNAGQFDQRFYRSIFKP
jgi:Divergent InlB B-repeat domain/Bacterial Ig domain